jgi:hypothetical protein
MQQDLAASATAAAADDAQMEVLDCGRSVTESVTSSRMMRRSASMNSISTHYFVSQKKLDIASIMSDSGGPDGCTTKEVPELIVPPRITVHTKMHINAMMCAAIIAVLIMSYYSSITTILRFKRWYALVVLVLVPVGAYFFSFAINTAVCGVFSVFLGECRLEGSTHCSSFCGILRMRSVAVVLLSALLMCRIA